MRFIFCLQATFVVALWCQATCVLTRAKAMAGLTGAMDEDAPRLASHVGQVVPQTHVRQPPSAFRLSEDQDRIPSTPLGLHQEAPVQAGPPNTIPPTPAGQGGGQLQGGGPPMPIPNFTAGRPPNGPPDNGPVEDDPRNVHTGCVQEIYLSPGTPVYCKFQGMWYYQNAGHGNPDEWKFCYPSWWTEIAHHYNHHVDPWNPIGWRT